MAAATLVLSGLRITFFRPVFWGGVLDDLPCFTYLVSDARFFSASFNSFEERLLALRARFQIFLAFLNLDLAARAWLAFDFATF